MSRGDAFLMPTPLGYGFGAVLSVDEQRNRAVIRFQAGDLAAATLQVVEVWKEQLKAIAQEVVPNA